MTETPSVPDNYSVMVGRAWLAIDFTVNALTVTVAQGAVAKTEEFGNGVLIDYDAEGNVLAVEVLGGS